MTQPKIELRKISFNKRLSEETPAYTAELWADGVQTHGIARTLNEMTMDEAVAIYEAV